MEPAETAGVVPDRLRAPAEGPALPPEGRGTGAASGSEALASFVQHGSYNPTALKVYTMARGLQVGIRNATSSAARELLYRLTERLEIPFSLTDREGVVLASTGARALGQIELNALLALRRGSPLEVQPRQPHETELLSSILYSPVSERAGFLAPGPGIYIPLRVADELFGVLVAHGTPDEVRTSAYSAAATAGMGLEFARGASASARESIGPDLALYTLLRGTAAEVRHARLIAKVVGWDFSIPRVAIVAVPTRQEGEEVRRFGPAEVAAIHRLVVSVAPGAPAGVLRNAEAVVLPEIAPLAPKSEPHQLAYDLRECLQAEGIAVSCGVGEAYVGDSPIGTLRRSYREALYAARHGSRRPDTPGVFDLRSLGTAGFLAPTAPSRIRLARAILKPLLAVPAVLATVRHFLDADLSLGTTAERSGLHRHTIRHHLQRARELTGLDPRRLEDAIQLKLALLLTGADAAPPRPAE